MATRGSPPLRVPLTPDQLEKALAWCFHPQRGAWRAVSLRAAMATLRRNCQQQQQQEQGLVVDAQADAAASIHHADKKTKL